MSDGKIEWSIIMDKKSIYDFTMDDVGSNPVTFEILRNKVILIVNVASKCGFTNQYKGLQELYVANKDKLMIIGVPCNQFGGQEPGSASDIQSFCELNYGVTFLITEKIEVKGDNQHPLYKWLTKWKNYSV